METSFKIEDKNLDGHREGTAQHSTAAHSAKKWRSVVASSPVYIIRKKQLYISNIGVQSIKTYI